MPPSRTDAHLHAIRFPYWEQTSIHERILKVTWEFTETALTVFTAYKKIAAGEGPGAFPSMKMSSAKLGEILVQLQGLGRDTYHCANEPDLEGKLERKDELEFRDEPDLKY